MDSPTIERTVTLNLMGDWGYANLHRVCGWIASQIVPRCGAGSAAAIWTGDGWLQNLRALAEHRVDVAVITPASLAAMAMAGKGPCAGQAQPDLRALGVVPQFDRLVLGVRPDFGVSSFEDLRRLRPPLRISTADGGDNLVGWAARLMMEASGIPEAELTSWGGRYVSFSDRPAWSNAHTSPFGFVEKVGQGEADAVIFEAIMLPVWQQVAREPGLRIIPVEEEVLTRLEGDQGWPRATVPANYFPGQEEPVDTLDFADFLAVCREDMPDDLAHLIAYCMGETKDLLERQYRHIPPERSPVTYPLDPIQMGTTPIPLHPGAARYYQGLQA